MKEQMKTMKGEIHLLLVALGEQVVVDLLTADPTVVEGVVATAVVVVAE